MRILFVIDTLKIGGVEKLTVDLILHLYQKHTIGLYILKEDNSFLLEKLKHIENINIYSGHALYTPLHIFRIFKLAKQYDIIHVNLFPALYWSALAIPFLPKSKKFIYTEHSSFNRRRKYHFLKTFERWAYSQYNTIIAITDAVKNNLTHWIGNDNHIVTINNGIDTSIYASAQPLSRESLNIPINATIVLMSARFTPAKDHETVIKTLLYLRNKNVHILFAGDGPLKCEGERLAEALKLSDRIHFLGIREDIPNLIKTADICVLSSHWEGFGLSAIEYMAAGKPVIASNVNGLNDIVRDAGLLFNHGNEKELAAKIDILIEDKNLYNNLALACKQRSLQFDINKIIDSYLTLYHK